MRARGKLSLWLVEDHDGRSLRKHVFAVGKQLGFDLEPDDEEPQLIWGTHPGGREFWISLGEGVLAFDCTVPAE